MHWWLENIPKACRDIHLPKVDFTIHTDVNGSGLGGTDEFSPIGGRWGKDENKHINYLELKSIFNSIQCYHFWWQGCSILELSLIIPLQ